MNRYQRVTVAGGQIAIVLTCFFIPLSTSLMGLFAALAGLFWIISGKVRELPRLFTSCPTSTISLLLLTLFGIGVFYAPIPISEGFETFGKYRELLYIPLVLIMVKSSTSTARWAENGFVWGCVVLMVISYAMYFSLLPSHKYGNSVLYHITHNYFMALLAFWSLQRLFDWKKRSVLWAVIFLLALANIVWVNPGRTGMLVFLVLTLLTLIQRLSFKYLIGATLLAMAIFAGAFMVSENLSKRTIVAFEEIKEYKPGKSRTSLGMRFDWWQNSVDLIKQKPLLGHGTGSYPHVQGELIKGKKTAPTNNPHNEYLLIWVQVGLVGAVLYVLLLGTQLIVSFKLPPKEKYLLQGVVISMVLGCLINSFLFDSHQGHFYAILSSILLAARDHGTTAQAD